MPMKRLMFDGGTKDANRANGSPVFESHANCLSCTPDAPQSSQDRLMPNPAAEPTRNIPSLTAVPSGVVTRIRPVVTPAGATASISASDTTLKLAASRVRNRTEVAPVKRLPVIVTGVPSPPEVGVKPVITGSSEG